jgi:hypothetical protein
MYWSPEDTKRIAITQLQRKSILAPFVVNTTVPELDVSEFNNRKLNCLLVYWTTISETYPITSYPQLDALMNQVDKTTSEFPTTVVIDTRPGKGETESQSRDKYLRQRRDKEQHLACIEAGKLLVELFNDPDENKRIIQFMKSIVSISTRSKQTVVPSK